MSLEVCALEAKSGNPNALDRLWSAVRPSVTRWVNAEVLDPDAAEDIIQLVLIQIWRRLVTFRGESRFTSWLYAVTRNQIKMARRAEARHWRHRVEVGPNDMASPGPEERYLDAIVAATLAKGIPAAVASLPPAQRLAFIAVDLDGKTPTQAAKELPVGPGTVRSNLFKARRQPSGHDQTEVSGNVAVMSLDYAIYDRLALITMRSLSLRATLS